MMQPYMNKEATEKSDLTLTNYFEWNSALISIAMNFPVTSWQWLIVHVNLVSPANTEERNIQSSELLSCFTDIADTDT